MTSLADSLITALPGQLLGEYRLDDFLGRGRFGLVFQATHSTTQAQFAVKLLIPSSDPQPAAEFDSEGDLLRRLNGCAAVVNLVDSGIADIPVSIGGTCVPLPFKYHVLSLASGSLDELTSDPRRLAALAWADRLSLWRGAIKGIHQMHLKSVAHRDLKADNCLLVVSGRRTALRVADLGRAKNFSLPSTLLPHDYLSGRGDRRFAPPEFLWFQGGHTEADFRAADLYGLGSLLAELATGHPMTALAIASWQSALVEGQMDLAAGIRRDLSVLKPQFRRAVDEVADQMPLSIRGDGRAILGQLCDPVPTARFPPRRAANRRVIEPGLTWLLRRADILAKRFAIEEKNQRRSTECERRIS